MPGYKFGCVRVVCTQCPWQGMRDRATYGEAGCPKCGADVRRHIVKRVLST